MLTESTKADAFPYDLHRCVCVGTSCQIAIPLCLECSSHRPQPVSNLREWWPSFRISRPALFHQFPPLGITPLWHWRPKSILQNSPYNHYQQIKQRSNWKGLGNQKDALLFFPLPERKRKLFINKEDLLKIARKLSRSFLSINMIKPKWNRCTSSPISLRLNTSQSHKHLKMSQGQVVKFLELLGFWSSQRARLMLLTGI